MPINRHTLSCQHESHRVFMTSQLFKYITEIQCLFRFEFLLPWLQSRMVGRVFYAPLTLASRRSIFVRATDRRFSVTGPQVLEKLFFTALFIECIFLPGYAIFTLFSSAPGCDPDRPVWWDLSPAVVPLHPAAELLTPGCVERLRSFPHTNLLYREYISNIWSHFIDL